MLGIELGLAGKQAIEHKDCGVAQNFAQFFALHRAGHEEAAATGLPQGFGHWGNAEAIGVAFDSRAAFGFPSMAVEIAPVLLNGAEVDGEDGSGEVWRDG